MGNCFGNKQKKKHANPCGFSAKYITEMVRYLEDKGQRPAVTRGGMAFTIDYKGGDPQRQPARKIQREIEYQLVNNPWYPAFLALIGCYYSWHERRLVPIQPVVRQNRRSLLRRG